MDKKKLVCIVTAVAAVALIAAVVAGTLNKKGESGTGNNDVQQTGSAETVKTNKSNPGEKSETGVADAAVEEKTYMPTFMYFVSKNDAEYNEAMNAVESLKAEYEGRVKFDIVDVDENPEAKKNFEMVDGNTPFLIMLNTKNDISAFEFKCADKDKLDADIKNALK